MKMEEKTEKHIFKNSVMFMESGNLRNDLYRAFKDELMYLLETKYRVYLDEYCLTYDRNLSAFYKVISWALQKLVFIMQDSTLTNLRSYVDDYNRTPIQLIDQSTKKQMAPVLTILREFDIILSKLVFDIMIECNENNIQTRYGVFSIINQYFEKCKEREYSSVDDVLEKCYGVVYETIRLSYGGTANGKKF